MDDNRDIQENDTACLNCRWLGLMAQPYGSLGYFCTRRQDIVSSALLGWKRCPEFER